MAESFELKSVGPSMNKPQRSKADEVIINDDQIAEEDVPVSSIRNRLMKEYNFFVDKNTSLGKSKRRRSVHSASSKSAADIINSELANIENPITETIVSMPTYNSTDHFVDASKNCQGADEHMKLFSKMTERLWAEHSNELLDENGYPLFHLTPLCPKTGANLKLGDDLQQMTYYVPPVNVDSSTVVNEPHNSNKMCLLDIKFNSFKFKHHPLYSLEQILSECLTETYAEYENRKTNNILRKIKDDLRINRNAREKVKTELIKLNRSKEEMYLDPTILKYTKTIEDLKETYYNEHKRDDDILAKIILLWKDLQKVRRETSIVNSPLVIEILKENISQEDITEIWNEMYNSEWLDEIHNIEQAFAKKHIEYKNLKYNKENVKKNSNKLTKPRLNIDEGEIRQRIEIKLNELVPKSPKITLKLRFEENITTTEVSNPFETDRRKEMNKNIYYFRMYVDESIVCESNHFSLDSNFCTNNMTDSFSIQILPLNNFISITLVENNMDMSKIQIDISNISRKPIQQIIFNTKAKIEAKDYIVGSGNTLLDICKKLNVVLLSTETIKNKFYTKGQLSFLLAWSDQTEGSKMTEVKHYIEVSNKVNKCLNLNEGINFDVLCDIIVKVCDAQEELETYMAVYNKLKSDLDLKYPHGSIPALHDAEQNLDNPRYKLLHYRDMKKFYTLNKTIVPLHSSQISTEQIQCLSNKTGTFDKLYVREEHHNIEMEPLDLQRYLGAKYINILNTHIQQNLHDKMLQKSYEDVVHDKQSINRRLIFSKTNNQKSSIINQLSNVIYKHPSAVHNMRVTIFRAFCLPDRTSLDDNNTNPIRIDDEGFTVKQLRPFVRVSYNDVNEQTSTAIGCNPTWNQVLQLSLRPGVPSVININIYDEVKEDLLDAYETEEPHQSNKVHYRLSHRWLGSLQIPLAAVHSFSKVQGALKINTPPITLGYQNSTDQNSSLLHTLYDPVLQMQKDVAFITVSISMEPHLQTHVTRHTSYLHRSDEGFIFRHLTDFLTNYSKEFPSRMLSLTYFTTSGHQKCVIQFLQALPLPDLELLPRDLKVYPRRESAMSKSSSSSQARSGDGRKSRPDERGDSANTPHSSELWTGERNSAQKAPELKALRKEGSQLESTIHACARYVSLIPMYEASQGYEVTLMGWELLKILHGSPLDHTILLTSYLLYLGVKCWIISGIGLPRGFSSYVLIKYNMATKRILLTTDNTIQSRSFYTTKRETLVSFIYDAVTGIRYDLRDACCPLKTVHYVYSDENIWINLQLIESTDLVRLDFTRAADWQPVFNKNISLSKLPTISEHNLYAAPEHVDSLKQKIENKIKAKVQKWRSHRRTIWNRYCSSVLKESLPNWEYWAFNPASPKPAPSNRLKQLMSTYKIYGFPLNLPYTNMKRILSSIKSTALFLNEDRSVEFGLAVEMYSYPGAVSSLWVYLASITRS